MADHVVIAASLDAHSVTSFAPLCCALSSGLGHLARPLDSSTSGESRIGYPSAKSDNRVTPLIPGCCEGVGGTAGTVGPPIPGR